MTEREPTTARPQSSPELEKLWRGPQLGEFFAMDDAAMERVVELLLAEDQGYMAFSALEFLEELDRRATRHHATQVEAYAKNLTG
jgi:hypothetical protein